MRLTIRTRLTGLFALLFTVLAGVLIGTAYLWVAGATAPAAQQESRQQLLAEALAEQGVELPGAPAASPSVAPTAGASPAPFRDDAVGRALRQIEEQARQNVLDQLLTRSLLAFAACAVAAVALAYWLAGRVLRPVDQISRAAAELSEATLDRRLPSDGPDDEFGRLRTAFNGMLGRLESAFAARQRFAADASHELRTPLAVLRASADNVLAAPRASRQARELALEVEEQVARADSLMTSLLTLARADDVIHTRHQVDLADLAAQVVSAAERRATEAGITVDLDLADAPVLGDPVLLERLIANLVDNALRYNAEDGWVGCRVGREGTGTAARAVIEIANAGPRVDPVDVPALFERFRRGDHRTEVAGHGLGLPIVARVAEVHGGSAAAVARTQGGLIVKVTVPAAG